MKPLSDESQFKDEYYLYTLVSRLYPNTRLISAPNDDYMLRMVEIQPPIPMKDLLQLRRVAKVARDGEIIDTVVQVVWEWQTDGRYSRFDPSVACTVTGRDYDKCTPEEIYAAVYQCATDVITGNDYDARMNILSMPGGKTE